jgi:hypothetical protein
MLCSIELKVRLFRSEGALYFFAARAASATGPTGADKGRS